MGLDQQRSWAKKASSEASSTRASSHKPHAVSRRLGADVSREIISHYGAGETAQALAEEFGIARNSVLNLLRENNVVVRRQPPSPEQQATLARDYEAKALAGTAVSEWLAAVSESRDLPVIFDSEPNPSDRMRSPLEERSWCEDDDLFPVEIGEATLLRERPCCASLDVSGCMTDITISHHAARRT